MSRTEVHSGAWFEPRRFVELHSEFHRLFASSHRSDATTAESRGIDRVGCLLVSQAGRLKTVLKFKFMKQIRLNNLHRHELLWSIRRRQANWWSKLLRHSTQRRRTSNWYYPPLYCWRSPCIPFGWLLAASTDSPLPFWRTAQGVVSSESKILKLNIEVCVATSHRLYQIRHLRAPKPRSLLQTHDSKSSTSDQRLLSLCCPCESADWSRGCGEPSSSSGHRWICNMEIDRWGKEFINVLW